MKILMVNKFLYPNGGSETYIFKLGKYLQNQGHEVQYFGMEHEGRCVGNSVNAYTSEMDFHGGSKLAKLTYPIKTIYSTEARKKLRLVLDDFQPDAIHLNNFNYQLTPSIILEIVKWRNQKKKKCRIVFTAHDYQLLCPNHQLHNPNTHENCEKCLGGHFINCAKDKCIHGSKAKSVVGTAEAYFWKWRGAYKYIDSIICPSEFMKQKMDSNPLFARKTVALHNFVDVAETRKSFETKKKRYVLYFGRFSEEKGIATLIKVCKELPNIHFIFAGVGSLESELKGLENVECVGFKVGEELNKLVREAQFSVFPSEWYETYGLSVAESLFLGTPVVGSNIGGIPEIISDGVNGRLFESGNKDDLKEKICLLWNDSDELKRLTTECLKEKKESIVQYYGKIIPVYSGGAITITAKFDYVLYFGRFSEEKGLGTLLKVCKELPQVNFIFAGTGPLEEAVKELPNIKNVGFQKGEALETLIREARFSIYPSEWYENCPFSVMESQMYGTPVLGANIGGISELIQAGRTGELFESGNATELKRKIEKFWSDKQLIEQYSKNCKDINIVTIAEYYKKLMKVYQ